MAEAEDIEAQRELLRIHRRNLARYLRQQADHGGPMFVLPAIANGIEQTRADIRRIKAILRGWDQPVEDLPDEVSDGTAIDRCESEVGDIQQPESTPIVAVSPSVLDADGLEAYFTDVEHLRELFKDMISAPTLPKRLLVIHGVGGVGKSSLLRMFWLHCQRVGMPVALASGDETKSAVDILVRWHADLQAAGIACPSLTRAIARHQSLQTTVEQRARKAASVASTAIGSVFPIVGTIAGAAIGAIADTSGEALVDWLSSFLKKPDVDLVLDPTRQLTDALLADIAVAAPNRRIAVMLDTFEQLSALEDWVWNLAQRFPTNILVVIAGRAIPNWGRTRSGWLAQARVEELKPMTPEVMRDLVRHYYATMHGGEPDLAQVEAIVGFARGLPVVVTSAVQLWVAYGVEDFQSVKPQVVADLVDRLLEGVPRELVPMLEVAAALRWFNKDILRAISGHDDVSAAYDELRRFPFIRPRVEGLALHDAVREIIDENLRVSAPDRHCALHERAAAHFEARLAHTRSAEAEKLELERLYHSVRADEELGIRLFQETADNLARYEVFNRLQTILNDIRSYPLERENSQLWRKYYEGRMAHSKNRIGVSEKIYREISQNQHAEPKLRAYALYGLGNLLLDRDKIKSSAQEGVAALKQALTIAPKIDFNLAFAFSHLSFVHAQKGEWDDAEAMLLKQMHFFVSADDKYGVIRTLRSILSMYGWMGEWKKSLDTHKRILGLVSEFDGNKLLAADARARPWHLIWSGRLYDAERGLSAAVDLFQDIGHTEIIPSARRDIAYVLGLQNAYGQANRLFSEVSEHFRKNSKLAEYGCLLGFWGVIAGRAGEIEKAQVLLLESWQIRNQIEDRLGFQEVLNWLALTSELSSIHDEQSKITAESYYRQSLVFRRMGRRHFESAALTGLTRIKHAQADYAAIPPLLAEAEQLAQQYEYNDHLASLRLSQGHIVWDSHIPVWGEGFDAALAYYKQALIYALRYNRFLLDEALWGGGISTPLKPIIPHCLERTFEGQRMLMALRDWWQSGVNGLGAPRPDTISPLPEGIPLLEAERIAREREPGDGTPQRTVLESLSEHI
jgi:hypothetical protein